MIIIYLNICWIVGEIFTKYRCSDKHFNKCSEIWPQIFYGNTHLASIYSIVNCLRLSTRWWALEALLCSLPVTYLSVSVFKSNIHMTNNKNLVFTVFFAMLYVGPIIERAVNKWASYFKTCYRLTLFMTSHLQARNNFRLIYLCADIPAFAIGPVCLLKTHTEMIQVHYICVPLPVLMKYSCET